LPNCSTAHCEVKTRYLGLWQPRTLFVSLENNVLELTSSSGKRKEFPLNDVHYCAAEKKKEIFLDVPGGRKYRIRNNQELESAMADVQYYQVSQRLLPMVRELEVSPPRKLNYFATVRSLSYQEGYIPRHQNSIVIIQDPKT
jgi:hypothetical protein